jgi:uncharacterized membrane protein YeaQ/YmgE (transglycosylase-associated protein family)
VLILAIILFGLAAGGIAQMLLGKSMSKVDWTSALIFGLLGSFVGGLGLSLLTGNGIELRVTGLIGSIVGALVLTMGWSWWKARK